MLRILNRPYLKNAQFLQIREFWISALHQLRQFVFSGSGFVLLSYLAFSAAASALAAYQFYHSSLGIFQAFATDLPMAAVSKVSRLQSYAVGLGFFAMLAGFGLAFSKFYFRYLGDREAVALELKTNNQRFKAALDNMGDGLCMFDEQKRLVVYNKLYAELYRLPQDLLKIGTPHSAIIAHCVSQGILEGETSSDAIDDKISVLAQLPHDRSSSRIDRLRDGRFICVTRQPMEGGGWVATHDDVSEQLLSDEKIAHMAHHDALTDLPNRLFFQERLDAGLTRARRGERLAILCIDLDHFKNVNDTLGHPIGDKLLNVVADRLRKEVRQSDTIARLGGDEFAIVQVNIADSRDVTSLAARIVEALSEPYELGDYQVVVGASVGIAMAIDDGDTVDQLMKNADLALYRVKAEGRGNYCFFEQAMDDRMQARRLLELDLRKALVCDEFELHYQPLINVKANKVCGFEALVRWQHPERGLISPANFIPLAEEIGLIEELGDWILRQACGDAAQWPDDVAVAVNLSALQFRNDCLAQQVADALAASSLSAERLELEITESVLMEDNQKTTATLHRLRGLGIRISMDDFGTGYSSLSYLQSFPFDKIKIDRSFVKNLSDGGDALAIIRAVTTLSTNLGMTTTAEGVETEEQLEIIRSEGCTEVQGYLFSPARPAGDVLQLIRSLSPRVENAQTAA